MRPAFPKNLFISVFEWFGELGFFCARLFRAALVPPYEFGELLRQCDEIGSKSLPLVALAGAATGVVLSLQTRDSLIRFGAKSFLPAVIVFSIIKESGFKNALFSDFIPPTLKTMVFGFIIGLVSCFQGMRTRGGTEGVGRSATSSVVLSSLFVVVADVLLVRLILTIWG